MKSDEKCSHEGLECTHWVKIDGKWHLNDSAGVAA